MIDAAVLRALAAAGATADMIVAAVEQHQIAAELEKKSARRAPRRVDVSEPVWYSLRGTVFRRDGFRCTYCGSDGDGSALHCDHIFPISRGGKSTIDNLATACRTCNSSKKDMTPEEWRGK
jgi:5-methylcytosine-specific restriction endonuclease McrA